MDATLSTLKHECAEQGLDYKEVLHQRANEIRLLEELGIELPDWVGIDALAEAAKPEAAPVAQK
jgi:capsid protein